MNAPRQGFFAIILAISFLCHVVLMVQNSLEYQSIARDSQGSLFLQQLCEESKVDLANNDSVSLALLAQRYGEKQNISQILIKNTQKKLLAQGGTAPTRFGKTFSQEVLLDGKAIGTVDVTLFRLNRGEVLRSQWPYFIVSLFLHFILFWMYRRVARPEKHLLELYQINAQESVFQSTPLQPYSVGQSGIGAPNHKPFQGDGVVFEPSASQAVHDLSSYHTKLMYQTVLQVGFNDPHALLETLSHSIEMSYYQLNQTLLEKALVVMHDIHKQSIIKTAVVHAFNKNGAQIGIDGRTLDVLEFALELGLLFNALAEAVYSHHKQNNRFALHTKVSIAESTDTAILPAAIAKQMQTHTDINTVSIHCQKQFLDKLRRSFVFYNAPNFVTTKDCEALIVHDYEDVGIKQTIAVSRDKVLADKG